MNMLIFQSQKKNTISRRQVRGHYQLILWPQVAGMLEGAICLKLRHASVPNKALNQQTRQGNVHIRSKHNFYKPLTMLPASPHCAHRKAPRRFHWLRCKTLMPGWQQQSYHNNTPPKHSNLLQSDTHHDKISLLFDFRCLFQMFKRCFEYTGRPNPDFWLRSLGPRAPPALKWPVNRSLLCNPHGCPRTTLQNLGH